MKKEAIKEIIKDFHHGTLPHMRKRDIHAPVNTGKIITLSGVRRSGKTFSLYNIIQRLLSKKIQKENILYINFEDERLELKKEDLDMIIQGYRELYPDISLSECYFFLTKSKM